MKFLTKCFGVLIAATVLASAPVQSTFAMSENGDFDNYRPAPENNPIEKEYKFKAEGFEAKIQRQGSNLIVEVLYKGGYANNGTVVDGRRPNVLEARTIPYVDANGNEIFFGKPIQGIYYKYSVYDPKVKAHEVTVTTGKTKFKTNFII